tara:strand:- start:227 stop:691 length:465 start_codon:yes stop_codon:yes gene_type:complete
MVYATFGGLKGIFISVFLFSLYALFAFNEFTFLIAIAAILFSAGFIQFNSLNEKVKLLVVKNSLESGIEECLMRSSKKQSINFTDALSFSRNYKGFKIQAIDPNSCFKAIAVPSTDQNTWFDIEMDEDTGAVIKTCGDSSKSGCEASLYEGNTW